MSFVLSLTITLFVLRPFLREAQKGRGGGLASAFGGMGGNTAFGSKTGDVLTWATSIVFGIFLLLAVILNLLSNYGGPSRSTAGNPPVQTPGAPAMPGAPVEPAAPAMPEAPAAPAAPAPAPGNPTP